MSQTISPRDRGAKALLGICLAVLVLVADYSFAQSGLAVLAPISSALTVLGTWLSLSVAVVGLIVVLMRSRLSIPIRSSVIALMIVLGWTMHEGIVGIALPTAQTRAAAKLAEALAHPERIDFDPQVSETMRQEILSSRGADWKLRFANPMVLGYDFDFLARNGRLMGARVKPATTWNANERVWVFPEVGRTAER